jgi:hypothetical protein
MCWVLWPRRGSRARSLTTYAPGPAPCPLCTEPAYRRELSAELIISSLVGGGCRWSRSWLGPSSTTPVRWRKATCARCSAGCSARTRTTSSCWRACTPPTTSAAPTVAAAVSRSCAWIGSPCLRQCVHGASIGGGERQLLRALEGVGGGAEPWPQLRCVCVRAGRPPAPWVTGCLAGGRLSSLGGCLARVGSRRARQTPRTATLSPCCCAAKRMARQVQRGAAGARGGGGAAAGALCPGQCWGWGGGDIYANTGPPARPPPAAGLPWLTGMAACVGGRGWVSAAGPRLGRRSGARARALARRVAVRQRRGGGVAGDRARLPAREQGVLHAAQRRRPHRRGLRRAVPAPGGGGEPWD